MKEFLLAEPGPIVAKMPAAVRRWGVVSAKSPPSLNHAPSARISRSAAGPGLIPSGP